MLPLRDLQRKVYAYIQSPGPKVEGKFASLFRLTWGRQSQPHNETTSSSASNVLTATRSSTAVRLTRLFSCLINIVQIPRLPSLLCTIADRAMATFSKKDSKPRRLFSYPRRRNKDKEHKRCLSDSVAADLEDFFRSTSISNGPPGEPSNQGAAKFLAKLVKPKQKDKKKSAEERGDGLDWSQVPKDPPRAVGILLVVTSPEGQVKLAQGDDDKESRRPLIKEKEPNFLSTYNR